MKRFILLLVTLLMIQATAEASKNPKYIFYFIGDGMGHNHIALTEATMAAKVGKIGYEPLNFTKFPVVSYVTTNAQTRLTTCSAAAGTALATGTKTSIGTIGMNADHSQDLQSIAVRAKNRGMKVGIATSVSIDHATPASFYAHAEQRDMHYKIATWMAKAGFDLYASSGLLKPNEQRNIFDILTDSLYTIIRGAGATLDGSKIYWQQADGYPTDIIPLAIDSRDGDLTLSEITQKSIDFLDNDNGFFLMVEGGQIDWAAHANDAASIVHETKDFANAIDHAIEFYNRHPDETLIVVTADHETGGLALGTDSMGYETDFALLLYQKMSKGKLESAVKSTKNWEEAKALLRSEMGFWDKVSITDTEEQKLFAAYEKNAASAATLSVKILAHKAGVDFTTGSHTAAYVPLFAIGRGSELFVGRCDNTEVPHKIDSLIK